MAKRTINIGTPDMGDGDTLRDAFIKTNENFDELYGVFPVTDTSLDHDDPTVEGSIAKALLDASTAGGGMVLVGPGTFNCPNSVLTVPGNIILKGTGRVTTTIWVTGSHDGIALSGKYSAIESLKLRMPSGISGDGITVIGNYTHLRDLMISGVGLSSWGINLDRTNVCNIDHVLLGIVVAGGPDSFTGNGILFQNTDPGNFPFNYGDSRISKVDITLNASNTTGIKFVGPDDTNNVINNILLSQVEIIGTGSSGNCTGVHLQNAKRITFNHVDLENLGTAIFEESTGSSGANISSNNVYISTFVLGSATSYASSGQVNRRLFLGCDNLTPAQLSDNDVMIPEALWLNEGNCRAFAPVNGRFAIDDGDNSNGIRFEVDSTNPVIKPSSADGSALLTLGRAGSQGVECVPGIVLPLHSSPLANAAEGTLAQFEAGIVGAQRGLYQLRDSNWVFVG